jgi:1-acyl-sn-glycerol-3-phosphate acyltransferase
MKHIIITALVWTLSMLSFPFMYIIAFLTWLFTFWWDKRLFVLHQYSCFWAGIYIWLNPLWSTQVEGRKKISNNKAYVLVSNHQSLLDICLIYSIMRHFKWVSKAENFKLPMAGWNMTCNKYIKLHRESRSSMVHMMRDCEKAINEGSSIMIFPEGTRTIDGNIQRFKDGAFKIAQRAKTSIIPIVIDGTYLAIRKNSIIINGPIKFNVKVLDEIPYNDFKDLPDKEISEKVRGLMIEELQKMRSK